MREDSKSERGGGGLIEKYKVTYITDGLLPSQLKLFCLMISPMISLLIFLVNLKNLNVTSIPPPSPLIMPCKLSSL